jgi:hypothetical protein
MLQEFCAVSATMLLTAHAAFAQANTDQERAELAEAVSTATETLQAGLSGAAKYGQPVSEVVDRALAAHPGFRALSVVPVLKDGHPVAEVALVKGAAWKAVSEALE